MSLGEDSYHGIRRKALKMGGNLEHVPKSAVMSLFWPHKFETCVREDHHDGFYGHLKLVCTWN